ncbi:hypothetical protein ABII15_23715 [Streptomyces sp. HUAS MG91]|uniref:DUF304 domain-containing protein n=1 Tax=Streptomyces tabacisoli TaxID=3156398 RepID=A0AAU8IX41_9ACTN
MADEIAVPEGMPGAPDVELALSYAKRALAKFTAVRLCLILPLTLGPVVGVNLGFFSASVIAVLPILPGLYLLFTAAYRLRYATRLLACRRILRLYPLVPYSRVVKKKETGKLYGVVFALRVSTRGQHGAPLMRGLNATGSTKWPAGFEEGGWVAGDLPYGGVLLSPTAKAMLFIKPDDWGKSEPRRRELGPEREELARRAGLHDNKWREPMFSMV